MKIPHLAQPHRSQFYPLVCKRLAQNANLWPLIVPLAKPGGYKGEVTVHLRTANEVEFDADVELADWTRFPARIRATATALRDAGRLGSYQVNHNDGTLEVRPS